MNKKLIAVAVAGLFAAPTAALAQSSVVISGFLKGGFENLKIGNATAARSAAGNTSQSGVTDDSSRIVFNVREDLGGGLSAIVQVDMRLAADTGALAATGNSHWGLQSKSWGRIILGRQDLHYFNTESNLTDRASLRASSVSLLAHINAVAIAGATRTTNVVHYLSPNWSGFTIIGAYSANPTAAEADIGAAMRKGRAWNLNPNYAGRNWQVGYSYWTSKNDAGGNTAATGDQRADRLYGSYTFPMGLKLGFAWDKSKIKGATNGTDINKRTAWSIPVGYTMGAHSFHVDYTKAGDDTVTVGDQKAKMWALAYTYSLSKRTSVALTYASIKNNSGATYNLFTSGSLGLGAGAGAMNPGEDPKTYGVTLRHAF